MLCVFNDAAAATVSGIEWLHGTVVEPAADG